MRQTHWDHDSSAPDANATHAEWMSALADGQLHGDAFARALALAEAHPEARQDWSIIHLVGDAMRAPVSSVSVDDASFMLTLRARIQAESQPLSSPDVTTVGTAPASNDSVFRWRMLAGAATLVAAGSVIWNLTIGRGGEGVELARQTAPAPVVAQTATGGEMLRDPRLDALLLAHRQQGGQTAFESPAGFLRTAAHEGGSR